MLNSRPVLLVEPAEVTAAQTNSENMATLQCFVKIRSVEKEK